MTDWVCLDTEPQPDGFVGGDGALESVSLRFIHRTEPTQVTVYMYVVDREERGWTDEDGYPFDYEEMVEHVVGEDRADIVGTEVWTNYTYDHPSERSWETEVEAEDYRDAEARRWIATGHLFLAWDGKPVH